VIRQAIQIFKPRGQAHRAGVASYFIQVNTEDFVEDRLTERLPGRWAFDTFRKTVRALPAGFLSRARPEDL